MPIIIAIFNPHIADTVIAFTKKFIKNRIKKKKKIWKFLENLVEDKEFDFGEKMIEVLKLIIVSLTYSAGIPIVYGFVSLGLVTIFNV